MSSPASTTFSFNLPFSKAKSEITLRDEEVSRIQNYTRLAKSEIPEQYENMRRVCLKVAPVALAAIATLVLSPAWILASMVSSYLLGHVSWVIPAVCGAILWSECKGAVESFEKGCTPAFEFAVAKLARLKMAASKEFSNDLYASQQSQ